MNKIPQIGGLTGLDRTVQDRMDDGWIARSLQGSGTRILLLVGQKVAVWSNADQTRTKIRWHDLQAVTELGAAGDEFIFLGRDDGRCACFAVSVEEERFAAAGHDIDALAPLVDLRSLALQGATPARHINIIAQARALAAWHDNHRYCGHCGATTAAKDGGWRRQCTSCGRDLFPRTDPAVIMLVSRGDHCLMGHNDRLKDKMYSTLAGFVEPGETIEQCVAREVREETAIEVGEVAYHSSQPWPFPHQLMIGCMAWALTDEITIDETELTDARWFSRKETLAMLENRHPAGLIAPGPYSIAHALIQVFVDQSD